MEDKAFTRKFFSIYAALVFQNVITISVNLADNVMLGHTVIFETEGLSTA